ncbi:MAG: O-antigen ligase family protein [Thermoleophilaceae bacterium]
MTAGADAPTRVLQAGLVATALALGLLAGLKPLYAIAAAVGLAFIVLALADLAVGVALFSALAALDILPAPGGFSLAKLLGLVVVISWVATLAVRHDSDFLTAHPYVSYVLFAFVIWAAISAIWAEVPKSALEASYRYGLNAVLLMIMFTAVRERRHIKWVLAAFCVGVAMAAMYGFFAPPPPSAAGRLESEGLNADELATALVAGAAVAGAFAVAWRGKPIIRFLAFALVVTCLVGILLTASRAGLVALAVALIASVGVGGRRRGLAAVGLVVLSLACVGYFAWLAPPDAVEHVTHTGGGTGRTTIWAVGWRMVEAHPFTGIGADNFQISSIHYLLRPGALTRTDFIVEKPKVAHNTYLEVLATLGIVGLLMFLSILAFAIRQTVRAVRSFARRGDYKMEMLARGVLVATFATLASDFFASEQFSKQLWLLLALGPAMAAVARRRESGLAEEGPEAALPAELRPSHA